MVSTESKVKFDYSILTEDRFALRNWFSKLGLFLEIQSSGVASNFFSPKFLAVGFGESEFNLKQFLSFWTSLGGDGKVIIRFP